MLKQNKKNLKYSLFLLVLFAFSITAIRHFIIQYNSHHSKQSSSFTYADSDLATNKENLKQTDSLKSVFFDNSRIRLTGTFITEINKSAIISVDQLAEQTYEIGEILIDGYFIQEIDQNYIIIQNKDHKIRIDERTRKPSNSTPSEPYPENHLLTKSFDDKLKDYINDRNLVEVEFPIGAKSEGIEQIDDNYFILDRALIEEQIYNNNALRHAKLEFPENHQAVVSEVVPGSLFDKAGIYPGDEIISIGDKPITSFVDFIDLYTTSDKSRILNVIIRREGTLNEFIYEYY